MNLSRVVLSLSLGAMVACGRQEASYTMNSQVEGARVVAKKSQFPDLAPDILADLPQGQDQIKALCARPGQDRVRKVFCAANPPDIRSLKDLQSQLGLTNQGATGGGGFFGGIFGGLGGIFGGGSNFVFTGASSSLVGRFTSAVNPRLVMFTRPSGNDPNMVALGFVRGEQFAEVISRDAASGNLSFFLVHFQQDCNDRPGGCHNGELLGPDIESNWREVTVYEDVDIENTILDCKQCHQPQGPQSAKMLRMQELRNPWTHFMRTSTAGGRALLADFQKAHPNEEFAGIEPGRISQTDPAQLENFVRANGFGNQPNEFSPNIEAGGGFTIGFFNFGGGSGSGKGAWQPLYDRFVAGEMIAPPYHQVKVTDPTKLEKMTQAYLDLKDGKITKEEFPDTRDVLLNSGLRDMGYMVKEGLTGEQIIKQACGQCHNNRLNQNISRAKFTVDLSKLDTEEKLKALERINLPDDDVKKMPPTRFRTLTPEEIKRVEQALNVSE